MGYLWEEHMAKFYSCWKHTVTSIVRNGTAGSYWVKGVTQKGTAGGYWVKRVTQKGTAGGYWVKRVRKPCYWEMEVVQNMIMEKKECIWTKFLLVVVTFYISFQCMLTTSAVSYMLF
jgi:hypothetical protein